MPAVLQRRLARHLRHLLQADAVLRALPPLFVHQVMIAHGVAGLSEKRGWITVELVRDNKGADTTVTSEGKLDLNSFPAID